MGSAALYELTRRGSDALGFDPLVIGEARGSSHGSCRVFRRFNFESEAYTALSDRAFEGWLALESASGRTILKPSAVLEAGPAGCQLVANSRAAALAAKSRVTGPRSGAEANAAFPAFNLPFDWDVVVQESGAILLAEQAMRAFRDGAKGRIIHAAAQMRATPAGIRIVTARGMIYGFPDFEGRGVKAAQHDHGAIAGADEWEPPATDAELDGVAATLAELVPGAAGPITDRDICLYTNAARADMRVDGGNEFIIDRLPQDPRIIVASPCSGHGAKFATAIGAMLADLALDPKLAAPDPFRLDRFSSFA